LHTHDGVDSEPVKYTDITGLPVIPTLPVTSEVEVFRVENQNANNAGWTGIGFTQTVVANGSALSVSPTNNGIVINTAGRYLIHAAASISPNTVGRRGITVHTGSPASFTPQLIMPALPSGGPGLVFSTIYNCSPGAQYTVYLFQDSGATLLASNVRFSMYLLY
jgi:hypothetical protein